jgi:hypothetical protein
MRYKIITKVLLLLLIGSGAFHDAFAGAVVVQSVQISPAETMAGKYPEIIGTVKANGGKASDEILEITVIASLARPDNAVKSWTWKKITIKAGEARGFSIPKEYDVNLKGVYKVDFGVYSKDMRPLSKLSKSFTVTDTARPLVTTAPTPSGPATAATSPGKTASRSAEEHHFGLGAYVNTVNTAGGATMLLWPSKYVGLQASYSMGNFTTAECRVLARFPLSGGINPYLGVGYASVTTERTVDTINSKTTFSDSGVTGALGVEVLLGKSLFGYVEVSGTAIDLKKEVSSGGVSGTAEVKYAPVTVGFSIVYFMF